MRATPLTWRDVQKHGTLPNDVRRGIVDCEGINRDGKEQAPSSTAGPAHACMSAAGLAGARGRSGRGAPKSGAPGWGAGRCKISGAPRFKTDISV